MSAPTTAAYTQFTEASAAPLGGAATLGFGRSPVGTEVGPVLLSPRERSGEGIN
jgi:hypothetical protein